MQFQAGRQCAGNGRAIMPRAFFEPHFDQRLIGDVARIRRGLDSLEGMNRQSQRDPLGRRFQVGQADAFRLRPINKVRAVMRFPEFFALVPPS
jgi:hypothetical protein